MHGAPLLSAAAAQADWSTALLDPDRPCPVGLTVWDGSDPAWRLAVHRNNVVLGLVQALADTFPVTQRLVGEAFFQAMVSRFVRQAPPASPVLVPYGEGLAEFIAGFAPARALPYLPDMARLEMARVQALHAADAVPLDPSSGAAALARLAALPAALPGLRLVVHPSLRVVCAGHGAVSLWAAHQAPDDAAIGAVDLDRPEQALVLRPWQDVLVVPVDAGLARLAQALAQQADLGSAAALAEAVDPDLDLAAALRLLLVQGALTDLQLP